MMNGTQIVAGSGDIGTLGAGWLVAGIGDFTDDLNADILLQNGQQLALWAMKGTSVIGGSGNIGTLGAGWAVGRHRRFQRRRLRRHPAAERAAARRMAAQRHHHHRWQRQYRHAGAGVGSAVSRRRLVSRMRCSA